MALDDYLETEVVVAAAVTAAVCSPPVRKVLRRGLVYGLAGLLIARDKVAQAAQSVAQSAQQAASAAANGASAQPTRNEPAASAAPVTG
jgi:hypothetical protein